MHAIETTVITCFLFTSDFHWMQLLKNRERQHRRKHGQPCLFAAVRCRKVCDGNEKTTCRKFGAEFRIRRNSTPNFRPRLSSSRLNFKCHRHWGSETMTWGTRRQLRGSGLTGEFYPFVNQDVSIIIQRISCFNK